MQSDTARMRINMNPPSNNTSEEVSNIPEDVFENARDLDSDLGSSLGLFTINL
jgi:hypothetical protein